VAKCQPKMGKNPKFSVRVLFSGDNIKAPTEPEFNSQLHLASPSSTPEFNSCFHPSSLSSTPTGTQQAWAQLLTSNPTYTQRARVQLLLVVWYHGSHWWLQEEHPVKTGPMCQ